MPREAELQDEPQSPELEDDSPSPEGEGSDPSDSGKETSSPPDGPDTGEGKSPDATLRHPRLRGRTPEEIDAYVQLLEETNMEQRDLLTEAMSRNVREEEPAAPDPNEEEYKELRFLDDPDRKLELFEHRVGKMLDAAVSPFREDVAKTQARTARQELRAKYDDFELLEPTIDKLLGPERDSADKQTLERLYFTAVGYAAKKGINLRGETTRDNGGDVDARNEAPVNPPNRRPSGAPPPAPKGEKKLRELTENERRLARQWNMTHEEYLEFQEQDASEVVEPGFSKEDW